MRCTGINTGKCQTHKIDHFKFNITQNTSKSNYPKPVKMSLFSSFLKNIVDVFITVSMHVCMMQGEGPNVDFTCGSLRTTLQYCFFTILWVLYQSNDWQEKQPERRDPCVKTQEDPEYGSHQKQGQPDIRELSRKWGNEFRCINWMHDAIHQ